MKRVLRASVIAALVTLTVPSLATATHWRVEADLRDEPLSFNRQTFIFDPGRFTLLPRDAFAQPDFVAFYTQHGFDRNYLLWAPSTQVNPDGYSWTSCKIPPGHPTGTFCASGQIHSGPVREDVPVGTLTAIAWGGSFISTVCGNWSTTGSRAGPVPRLAGTKFDDRNRDGNRDAGEAGLEGWTIRLLYNGVEVARTTTTADGGYAFDLDANSMPIGAGSYQVVEVQQPGWSATVAPSAVAVGLGVGQHTFGGLNFGNRRDLAPTIEVTKAAVPDSVDEPGGTVDYTVSVRNVSADPDDVVIVDSIVDDLYGNIGQCVPGAEIAVGATWSCRFQGAVRGNAGAVVTDTVRVSVRDRDARSAVGVASASVRVLDVAPSLQATKTPARDAVPEPGASVSFLVTVTNDSPAASDPVTITALADDVFGDLDGRGTCAVGATIAAAETYTCTFEARVTGEGGTIHADSVSISGIDDDGNPVGARASAQVRIDDVLPSIRLEKTAVPATVPATGGTVTFTVQIANLSVEPVRLLSLVDDVFGDLAGRGTCTIGGSIPVDGTYTCSFSAFLDGVPWIDHVDKAAVRAEDNERNVASASDSATVDFVVPASEDCKITGGGKVALPNGATGHFNNNVHTPPDVRVFFKVGDALDFSLVSRELVGVDCSEDRRAASIFGVATIADSGTFEFRIDVTDAGEPPFHDTYRIRIDNGYDSGVQTLTEGNIQIHK